MPYEFHYVQDHIEVYDIHGNFLFSADTQQEAYEELRSMQAA